MGFVRNGDCRGGKREGYREENMVKVYEIFERNFYEIENYV